MVEAVALLLGADGPSTHPLHHRILREPRSLVVGAPKPPHRIGPDVATRLRDLVELTALANLFLARQVHGPGREVSERPFPSVIL